MLATTARKRLWEVGSVDRRSVTMSHRKEQILSRKLPPRLERVLKKLFIEPSRGLTRRLREDVPPQTAMRRTEAASQRAVDRLAKGDLEAFVPDLIEMIKAAPEEEREIEIPQAESDAETAVFAAFDALERALPYGTIALLTMMVGIHRPAHLATWYETLRLGQRVAEARGEERALQLKGFAWHVIENEHVPFLHTLLQAAWITDGKQYRWTNSIGDLVNDVRQKKLLGPMLWPEVRYVRNAASHGGGWIVNLERAIVVLENKLKDGTVVWTEPFEVDDLFEKLLSLVEMTYTLDATLRRAFARDLLNPMTGPLIRAIRTGVEDPALEAIGDTFVRGLLHARDRMFELGWKLAG